jgi:hypothetical protein
MVPTLGTIPSLQKDGRYKFGQENVGNSECDLHLLLLSLLFEVSGVFTGSHC